MILKMPFLTFSNINILFIEKKLIWRSYLTAKSLPIIKLVELINKKKFVKAVLNENIKTFVMHVTFLLTIAIYPTKKV